MMQNVQPSPEPSPYGPSVEPALTEPPNGSLTSTTANGRVERGGDSSAYVEAWNAHAQRQGVDEAARQRRRSLHLAREVVETAILALVIFLAVRTVVQNYRVEGTSMEPTYHTGQYVVVNKALYARINAERLLGWLPFVEPADKARYVFRGPRRGDVVVLQPPTPIRNDRNIIKRVIGVPGDHVVIREGEILVNGQPLEESYLPGVQTFCGGQWCDYALGPDEYYVIGDNRANTIGSHIFGPVTGDRIVGRAMWIYLPFDDFGPAPNGAPGLGVERAGRTR